LVNETLISLLAQKNAGGADACESGTSALTDAVRGAGAVSCCFLCAS
jgi:hypothetical protein